MINFFDFEDKKTWIIYEEGDLGEISKSEGKKIKEILEGWGIAIRV